MLEDGCLVGVGFDVCELLQKDRLLGIANLLQTCQIRFTIDLKVTYGWDATGSELWLLRELNWVVVLQVAHNSVATGSEIGL